MDDLRARMSELYEAALGDMVAIESSDINLDDEMEGVREHVAGLSLEPALYRFSRLFPWLSEAQEREEAEPALSCQLLVPTVTLTGDARVTDKADTPDAVESEMGRLAAVRRALRTHGRILPALGSFAPSTRTVGLTSCNSPARRRSCPPAEKCCSRLDFPLDGTATSASPSTSSSHSSKPPFGIT